MTPQQVVGTGIRLFALWLVLHGVRLLMAIHWLDAFPDKENVLITGSAILGGLCLLTALLLWLFPMLVANLLIPRTRHTNYLSLPGTARELVRVGCALLGLVLFTQAFPLLAWAVFRAFLLSNVNTSLYAALDASSKSSLAFALFQVVFAILIVAKAAAFARFVFPEPQSSEDDR